MFSYICFDPILHGLFMYVRFTQGVKPTYQRLNLKQKG